MGTADFAKGLSQTSLTPHADLPSPLDEAERTLDLEPRVAASAIGAAWEKEGGVRSRLGPELTGALEKTDSGYRRQYAGGEITWDGHGTHVRITRRMLVHWVGMECMIRQEGPDEIYGALTRIGGFSADGQEITAVRFGVDRPIRIGVRNRLFHAADLLYDGPPVPMVLTVQQAEHDSGDTQEVADDFSDEAHRIGVAVLSALGVDADAADAITVVRDIVSEVVEGALDLFGAADDRYPPGLLAITAAEVAPGAVIPAQPARRREGEEPLETWTHFIEVDAKDDGGNRGRYRHYFLVRVEAV